MTTTSTRPPAATTRRRRRAALLTAVLVPLSSVVGLAPAAAAPSAAPPASASLLPGNAPTDDVVLFSATTAGTLGGVSYDAADVLRLDRATRTVALVVDGSDLGLTGGVDGLAALSDGSLLLSPDTAFTHPELGAVEPEDVLRFAPTSLGETTAGALTWLLDGSDVGLDRPLADVDAIAVSPDGRLLVSTDGPTRQPGFLAKGQDLIALADATFGAESAGTWERYLVGADLGRNSVQDRIGGASVNAATGGSVFLSSQGRTTPPAVAAEADQVLTCDPTSLSPDRTSCALTLFEDLDVTIDALHVGNASWLDEDCDAPTFAVDVSSHSDGEVVDTGEEGTATGSFFLRGTAPVAATAVTVSVGGESAPAELTDTGCGVTWTREVSGFASGAATFTVASTGPTGLQQASVTLDVRVPAADAVLVQPAFADTPQLHDRLLSYDAGTGVLVFRGDATDVLQPGDGLGGDASALAPQGYLRIVEGVTFDGVSTSVATRQAGLTELVRQIEIDYQSDPTQVEPLVFTTETAAAAPAAALRAAPGEVQAMSLIPLGPETELNLDFQVDPGVEFQLDVDWARDCWFCLPLPSLERLWFEGSLALQTQVKVQHRLGGFGTGEQPFGPRYDDVRLGGVTIPTPIGVPIVITFEAESQAFYELELSAALKFEYDITVAFVAGYEYDADGGGRGAYRDASVTGGAPSFEDVDLGIVARAAAGIEVDFEVLLYGQGGIEIEARPQLELEAFGDVLDRQVTWEVKLVVPVDGSLEIEIKIGPVGWEREFGDVDFVTLSLLLFEGVIGGDGGDDAGLDVSFTGPPGAFPGQVFTYALEVENTGTRTATGVVAEVELPDVGSFVSSTPSGTPSSPAPGSTYDVPLPDIAPGSTATATVQWRAPKPGDVDAQAVVVVRADGLPATSPVSADVRVGVEGNCNPCGVTAAGTGLRNRAEGDIAITGLPDGATVTRAVLHWGVLYSGAAPRDTITLQGTPVQADVAATVSADVCWGESSTIGYTADVTSIVTGNGTYRVSDPPRGITRPDANPAGVLPYTDGASLVVFYVGGGASSQVVSDFTYSTNREGSIVRELSGINSLGLGASLTLAGPDGQNNAGEVISITGEGTLQLVDTWQGSDPQSGPSFGIGNLWDTDTYDVSSVLPAGQSTLRVSNTISGDCIGIGATVLEVAQR